METRVALVLGSALCPRPPGSAHSALSAQGDGVGCCCGLRLSQALISHVPVASNTTYNNKHVQRQ